MGHNGIGYSIPGQASVTFQRCSVLEKKNSVKRREKTIVFVGFTTKFSKVLFLTIPIGWQFTSDGK